jgi:hypothetical protein
VEYRQKSRSSKGGIFFIGFLVGVLATTLVILALFGYLIKNPRTVMVRAANLGMTKVVKKSVEKTVSSIPREYVAVRQETINRSVQGLTQAFSENRLSSADVQVLAGEFFRVMADQKITSREIDRLLKMIDQYSMKK